MSRLYLSLALCLSTIGAVAPAPPSQTRAAPSPAAVSRVVANDNRTPAYGALLATLPFTVVAEP